MADDRTQPAAEAPPPDYSGRVLGEFELLRRIGAGGMGQVYLARQASLKRQVAVKVLKTELAANTTALRRFQAEAEAVANITHAHIVQVYAFGEADGLHYMALEYVDGRNLKDFLEKKGLPDVPVAVDVMRQVASALERAGELGFVHRDVKPENILVSRKGEVKVTDFGLSRAFGTDAPLNLTQSGVTMGTPLYMSPEQVRGQPVDPRSDIYSFGVTCYHMLAGEPPFQGSTAFDVAIQHVQGTARPLAAVRPDLPPELCAIVHRMMAKRPEDRYQTAREILNDLARFKEGAGLPPATMTAGVSVFTPAVGNSSAMVPAYPTQAVPARPGVGRYLVVAGLALLAAGAGATVHWARTPHPPAADPKDALADTDPSPAEVRKGELRRQLNDKVVSPLAAADDLLELAGLLVRERRFDQALKLFDPDAIRKLGAFEAAATREPGSYREVMAIVPGLGRGVVLADMDKPNESNAEFRDVLNRQPLAKLDPKAPKAVPRAGPLELFFARNPVGANWRRSVGEALDRNEKNLGEKLPPELTRLRMLPGKGPAKGG